MKGLNLSPIYSKFQFFYHLRIWSLLAIHLCSHLRSMLMIQWCGYRSFICSAKWFRTVVLPIQAMSISIETLDETQMLIFFFLCLWLTKKIVLKSSQVYYNYFGILPSTSFTCILFSTLVFYFTQSQPSNLTNFK